MILYYFKALYRHLGYIEQPRAQIAKKRKKKKKEVLLPTIEAVKEKPYLLPKAEALFFLFDEL